MANDTPSPFDWYALAHRWFVQYNPLYLVSASLVLTGVFFTSRGLSLTEGFTAEPLLTGVTELYQGLLIGAAALLWRAGQRRPAVMLALLEAIYLCDLTLQTGVAPLMGGAGAAVSLAWYAMLMIKLRALAWALDLRAHRQTWLLLAYAGALLAAMPHLMAVADWKGHVTLLPLSAFGLGAAGCWLRREIASRRELDAWGQTVLRRVNLAGWPVWGLLMLGHMLWWGAEHGVSPVATLAAALLPWLVHRSRTEVGVWAAGVGYLLLSVVGPHLPFMVAAMMAASAMALRAWRGPGFGEQERTVEPEPERNPYRAAGTPAEPPVTVMIRPARPTRAQQARLVVGVVWFGYLSLWVSMMTLIWPSPLHHTWPLELFTSGLLLLLLWRYRVWLALLPLAQIGLPHLVEFGHRYLPDSELQWGALLLALGFASLITGVAINWRLRGPVSDNLPDP